MEWFNWVEQVLRNYAQFNGRSRRKEYWYFMLFYYCVVFAFSLLSVLTFGWILLQLFLMAMLIPSLAVTVRRLHDVGKSGAWILVGLVPIFGWVVMVIWLCQDSQPGSNRYGANPVQMSIRNTERTDLSNWKQRNCDVTCGRLRHSVWRWSSGYQQSALLYPYGRRGTIFDRFEFPIWDVVGKWQTLAA